MRLIIDLRLAAGGENEGGGDTVLTLGEVVEILMSPRRLPDVLWRRRYDEVTVLRDDLPQSGVQAVAGALAVLARSRSFVVSIDRHERKLSRVSLTARAIKDIVINVPRELIWTYRLSRRAHKLGTTPFRLTEELKGHTSVAYIRGEPSLLWWGSFVGGAATHTIGVINGLADNGLDVQVYAADPIPNIEKARFKRVPLKRVFHIAHWMTFTEFSREIVKTARKQPADFVYQRYALGSYSGLELARQLGVPLVLEFNGSEIWAEENWGEGKLRFLDRLRELETRNLHDAALIIVVSDVLKEQLVDLGIDAQRVLSNPNGVDVGSLAPVRSKPPQQWRNELGLADMPTIGFIGSFGLWHGVKVLPEMIDRLKDLVPEARWMIIGEGLLFDEVRDEIAARGLSDRVTLTGVIEHERAIEHLAACDVCVSPHVPNPDGTRFFGSPTKLFEYMGLGKPIVASDLEQIGEVIEHERTGLLCEPGDGAAAAEAIARLLGDDELRKRLGDAALESANSDYSWAAHVRRILEALEQHAARGSSA